MFGSTKYFEQGRMNDVMRQGAQTSEVDLDIKTERNPDRIRRKLSGNAVTLSVRRHRPDASDDQHSDVQPPDQPGTVDISSWPEEVLNVIAAHSGALRDVADLSNDVQLTYVSRYDFYNMMPGGNAIEVHRPGDEAWTDEEMVALLNAAHLVFALASKGEQAPELSDDDIDYDDYDDEEPEDIAGLVGPIIAALKKALPQSADMPSDNGVVEGEVVD